MKPLQLTTFVLACAIVIPTTLDAQHVTNKGNKTILEILTPPNGIHLYDNVFIDETEIANIHWLEYLSYVAKDSTREFYQSQLPDTTFFYNKSLPDSLRDVFAEHYLRYPGFRYFPVIGITYEQATQYCRWRSDAVNRTFASEAFIRKNPVLKEYNYHIEYRLPTESEWEMAASGGLDIVAYPYGLERITVERSAKHRYTSDNCQDFLDSLRKHHKKLSHLKFNLVEDYLLQNTTEFMYCSSDTTFGLQYIYDNPPNGYRLFNLIGNVAELVLEKGISKGGSYKHRLTESTIRARLPYDQATEWLGFRCVAIVHISRKTGSDAAQKK